MSEITEYGAAELARRIARRELSARQVVDAHLVRIEQCHRELNSLVVPRFEQARDEAVAADEAQARGQALGPLHGVPISLKECFLLEGTPSCIGLTQYRDRRPVADGPLVARLRRAGAIVLGKTNVPQLMFFFESDNPVYGRTNNPWNVQRTPGGSTGGEAALIAAGGSPLGLGSDLGGSIRVPAHFCGISGLKPTSGRLTRHGTASNLRGMTALVFQPGPLAREVEDLDLALRVLAPTSAEEADADAAPAPQGDFRDVQLAGRRIAMWTDDGFFSAAPAPRRAVEEAAAALRDRGATVERFSPPRVGEAVRIYLGCVTADGGADLRRLLAGSQVDRRLRRTSRTLCIPGLLRPGMAWVARRMGQPRTAQLLTATGPRSANRYWQLCRQRARYERDFLSAFHTERFDALICPPHALPALRHGDSDYLTLAASYAILPNLLGIPAGVVAATRVRPAEQSDRAVSADVIECRARDVEEGSAGLPVGVQVAAGHWREDVVLAVMSALEAHFRAQEDYPARPP